jgi:hypothetical protein
MAATLTNTQQRRSKHACVTTRYVGLQDAGLVIPTRHMCSMAAAQGQGKGSMSLNLKHLSA